MESELSHEQLIFMQVLRGVFEDRDTIDELSLAFEESLHDVGDESDVSRLLHFLSRTACLTHAHREVEQSVDFGLSVLVLQLEVIAGAVGLLSRDKGAAVRDSVSQFTAIIPMCARILSSARPVSNSVKLTDRDLEGSEERRQTENQLVKTVLQLLGNLIYGSASAQDTFGSSGCMEAVLSRCATDFGNPLAREWALLCVRNACEGHAGNQAFVESLSVQGVVPDKDLEKQGISLTVKAGKLSFEQKGEMTEEETEEAHSIV